MLDASLVQLVEDYQMPQKAKVLLTDKKTRIVLMVSPAGGGKDSIIRGLMEDGSYARIVSHTTRQPRVNNGVVEKDSVDYYFVSPRQMKELLVNQKMIEAKQYSGNIYGTSIDEIAGIRDSGKIAITDLEVQGVAEYKNTTDAVIAVFVLPPSFDQWMARLQKRGKLRQDDLQKRLKTAESELKEALAKDYFGFVVNNDLQQAIDEVQTVVAGTREQRKIAEARELAERLLLELNQHLSGL